MRYSLEVVTPAATAPITVAEYKAAARVTASSEDTLIATYIEAATKVFQDATNLQLIDAEFRLTLDDFSGYPISLRKSRVKSIESVKYYDLNNVQQTLSPDIYELRDSKLGIFAPQVNKDFPSVHEKMRAVEINFIAGFGDADDIPKDIRSILFLLTSQFYEDREARELSPYSEAMRMLMAPYKVYFP